MTNSTASAVRYVLILSDTFRQRYVATVAHDVTDSAALHSILCEIDPGQEYLVRFSSHERLLSPVTSMETVSLGTVRMLGGTSTAYLSREGDAI